MSSGTKRSTIGGIALACMLIFCAGSALAGPNTARPSAGSAPSIQAGDREVTMQPAPTLLGLLAQIGIYHTKPACRACNQTAPEPTTTVDPRPGEEQGSPSDEADRALTTGL